MSQEEITVHQNQDHLNDPSQFINADNYGCRCYSCELKDQKSFTIIGRNAAHWASYWASNSGEIMKCECFACDHLEKTALLWGQKCKNYIDKILEGCKCSVCLSIEKWVEQVQSTETENTQTTTVLIMEIPVDYDIDTYDVDINNKNSQQKKEELSEEDELSALLKQKQRIKDEETKELEAAKKLQLEYEQHIEDAHNNLKIFATWMQCSLSEKELYKAFRENFTEEYRTALFEDICEFFKDPSFVTDDVLFFWKFIVISLLRTSRKYKSYITDLVFDLDSRVTNFRMIKTKYIYRCFIGEEPICYFKENGNDYYIS